MSTPSSPRIMIVEDEPALADAIRYGLERAGFRCGVSGDGPGALAALSVNPPDLVVLDLMLPGMSGEEVCREIRARGSVPVIILSAKDAEIDRVLGLELGADDYVTKPFSTRELIARIRTVLRRVNGSFEPQPVVLTGGPIELDVDRHEVRVRGALVSLPPKEFDLLATLMRRTGRLCTREMLIGDVWGVEYFGDTRTLDVHIKRLRAKIEVDPRAPRYLRTVRGLGYRFETADDTE